VKIVKKRLDELKAPERNIRLHTDKQIREFRRSIEMFGQIRPVVIDENGVVLAGNGLVETLRSMGRTEADCYVVKGLTESEKKKLMLADNRIFDLGVDDLEAFDAFILELKDDLDIPGFDEDMLRSLVMDADDVDDLISEYGKIPEEKVEEMLETRERYEAQEERLAETAVEIKPVEPPAVEVPQEVRDEAGYQEPFKAETVEHRYILCPKCGERIWL
jgi:ParB-like chromosome segregation protein Spo0J